MKTSKFKMFALGFAAFACACAPASSPEPAIAPAPQAAPAGPALWKLADEDTTVYLFGTIHLMPEGTQWRTPLIDASVGESESLVIEVLMPEDQAEAAQLLVKLGMSPGLPPLVERVPEDKRDALKELIASTGLPEAALNRMETWAAAITLTGIMLVRMGFDPELGVEKQLTHNYQEAGKPIAGLETAEQQLGFFDSLSEEAQRDFLAGTVEDPEGARAEFEAMFRAWLTGDVEGIARSFNDEVNLSAELREVLLTRRNAAWAEWLAERMDEPGTVFVAVGAGHLAGPGSVQAMLETKGLRATRLQ